MKSLYITIALLTALNVWPQSGQTKVMLQQIAALKTYGSYLYKGYAIARDGLSFIGNVKSGELSLHTFFYEGLGYVSPVVREYPKVQAILTRTDGILALNGKLSQLLDHDLFYGNEKDHIRRIAGRLLLGCQDDLDALQLLLSDSSLLADDAQRLKRIDALYSSMEERHSFAKAIYGQCETLLSVRQHELREINSSRELQNIDRAP